jgi:hypothetical protein
MSIVRLKIDVSGTTGDEAWREINQFDQIQSANFGLQFGSGGLSTSPVATKPYPKGAWIGAESSSRRRFWPSTPSRIIWNKTASSTPMS